MHTMLRKYQPAFRKTQIIAGSVRLFYWMVCDQRIIHFIFLQTLKKHVSFHYQRRTFACFLIALYIIYSPKDIFISEILWHQIFAYQKGMLFDFSIQIKFVCINNPAFLWHFSFERKQHWKSQALRQRAYMTIWTNFTLPFTYTEDSNGLKDMRVSQSRYLGLLRRCKI